MHPRFHLSIFCIPMYYVYHMIGDAYESHAVSVLSILSILSVVSILSICSEHTIQMMNMRYCLLLVATGCASELAAPVSTFSASVCLMKREDAEESSAQSSVYFRRER